MKKVKFLSAVWLALLLILTGAEAFSQDYEMTLKPRRLGNQVGVEVWVKSLSASAGPLGAMNIGVSYNGAKLLAESFDRANQPSSMTDAIQFDVDAAEPLPYYTISSDFHSSPARGFTSLGGDRISGMVSGTMRYVAVLDVNVTSSLGPGFTPASTGNGSFIGLLRFNILDANSLTDSDLAGFMFNPYSSLNTTTIMSGDGATNLTSSVSFVDPSNFTIRGITVLNPNQLDQTVNRYPENPYASMRTNHGYPIYFERSGLATPSAGNTYGTRRFAYRMEYSLDGGATYTEFGRVAESRDRASAIATADLGTYRSGWIDTLDGTIDYFVTTGNVEALPTDVASTALLDEPDGPGESNVGYGGVLRVIWKGDDNFPYRSENAKLRITQLNGTSGSLDEATRPALSGATQMDESDETFILGRMFFVQLDGTNGYFRSERNFSTPNSFTVEAWVNLNQIKGDGTEPGIVATSSGNASDEEGGWILYLKDGKYPAFRVRKAGGADGEYIGNISTPVALSAYGTSATLNENHASYWSHLAGVVSNNTVYLYVDGEEVARYENNSAVNVRPMNTKMPIWVGVNPNNGMNADDYFYGGIKEVKVWRHAMPQAELRKRISGVYDADGSITALTDGPNDYRTALELYYPLQASRNDIADNKVFQMNNNPLHYFTTPGITSTPQNTLIRFRPDRSHIKLTAPSGNDGVSNLVDNTYEVRWVAYGIGSLTTRPNANYGDVMIQISRDGGNTWFDAIDSSTPAMPMDNEEVENGSATWEPYNNVTITGTMNDLQGVVSFAGNYEKDVIMKVSGSESRNQEEISFTSAPFKVAPWFAYKNGSDAMVSIDGSTKLNITSQNAFFEAWIKPYSFPEDVENNYYPIFAKKDFTKTSDAEAVHYALRLLPSGQLQFVLSSVDANNNKTLKTAVSDPIYRLTKPNVMEFDSVWVHVGVWVNLPDNLTESQILFYVDGIPQTEWYRNSALEATSPIMKQLGSGITVDKDNTFITYLGYEPDLGGATGKRFDGELKEIRFWGGNPGGTTTTDEITNFVQGSLSVRADELGTFAGVDYSRNLLAAYSMNGGSWVNYGRARSFAVTPFDEDLVAKVNPTTTAAYESTTPLIKIVEPRYLQAVKNTDTDLKVRWVGFDYNRNDLVSFTVGTSANQADLQFSTGGGAGELNVPYQFVSSTYHNPGYTNALTLPTANSEFEFPGTSTKSQFAAQLNCSVTDPDKNKDGTYNDQDVIGAAMTNGRLQLRARANINTPDPLEYDNDDWGFMQSLISESSQFNITPPSNFTVRMLLEGYHAGSVSGIQNNIGDKFSNKGLRIRLFEDNAGRPGNYVENSEAVSVDKYADFTEASDVANRNAGNFNFANVPFVFTDVQDGRYFVVVDHLNYLPVMSAYAAPFFYTGDNAETWSIESGWDFQAWDGSHNNLILSTEAKLDPPTFGTRYTAYADESNFVKDRNSPKWAMTGLNFNAGGASNNDTTTNALPALVGGDVYRDGQITAADRAKVRVNALSTDASNDVTGDNIANAIDRTIVDQNTNKVSSLRNLSLQNDYIYTSVTNKIQDNPFAYISDADPMTVIYPDAPELTKQIIKSTERYLAEGGDYTINASVSKYEKTLAGGLEYRVTATPFIKDNYVEVPVYIQNVGGDFALANGTFAITFDPTVVRFAEMVRAENVIFSGRQDLGYDESYSSPTDVTVSPMANTRSIEISWNAYERRPGQVVPRTRTYLGTLRFALARNDQSVFFNWNKACAVLDTEGKDITSAGIFEVIKPIIVSKNFALLSPNGGEVWEGGVLYSVNWTSPAGSTQVYVEYSADNGSSWNRINANPIDANLMNYNWITPRINSSEVLVRLINAETSLEIDRSDAMFSIQSAPAEITRPSSIDPVYTSGKTDFIRWISKDKSNVRFEFSENGLTGWSAVTGTINSELEQVQWTVPGANTKSAVIRMVDVATNQVLAVSEPFKVLSGSVTITSPRGGDKLTFGEKRPVRWVYENVNNFTLQYTANGGLTWETIAGDVKASLKTQNWMVPDVTTKNAMVRAIYNNDPELEYHRTAAFEIKGTGTSVDNPELLGYALDVVPNPFNIDAKISFTLPTEGNVTISLYNTLGVKVASVVSSQFYAAGTHSINFNALDIASGMYSVRIEVGPYVISRDVIRIK